MVQRSYNKGTHTVQRVHSGVGVLFVFVVKLS